ncbi:MAG: hypothetical protein H6873_12985 [Hyphomicrobiaceae bacterium]|nr:hypothetical protein [Hyphomicrobiaceae bacterium]
MSEQREDQQELSPEARQLLQRARRFFVIFVAILLIGFVSIAVTLFLRVTKDDGGSAARYELAEISLPAGAELVSTTPDGNFLLVVYRGQAGSGMRVIDLRTGAVVKDVPAVSE